MISLVPVEGPEISNYGCAGFSDRQGDVITVDRLVEKPAFEDAPSNLRITGRYVLTPDIFEKLERTAPGRGGEIQLTDAMAMQIDDRGMRGLVVDDALQALPGGGDKVGRLGERHVARGGVGDDGLGDRVL